MADEKVVEKCLINIFSVVASKCNELLLPMIL